jgi:diguanylate cyclase
MTVLVNLAYPVGDLVLILLVIAAGIIAGQPSRRWFVLLLGLGTFAIGDSVYLAQVADGTYQGGIIDLSWVTGIVALSFLPMMPSRRRPRRPDPRWTLGLPLVFAMSALAVIVVHNLLRTSDLSLYLAVAALAASVPRLVLAGRDASMLAHVTRIAASDELTGLSNRRAFFESFETIAADLDDGVVVATMVIDLDGFKQVNDTHGHGAGDEVLRIVSHRFKGALRARDLLARLGGDEFGVVARCADVAEAEALAGRLVASLDEPIRTDRAMFTLRASIGIALAPTDGTDLDVLVARADEAMYAAKRAGGPPRLSGCDRTIAAAVGTAAAPQ